ncbi:hypothetical protein BV898_18562 [Hypsibius exemplaris]|uniref:UPAR/Ly6 domain-containing protein n=1 Tax=Hypsibius exemplaris TaxID=2072580 RepID=A0A9X6NPD4_HYPEX|nr:hypothetical protein BV898_18562 [Hypsibius exemplaris]
MSRALALTFFLIISLAAVCTALSCYECQYTEGVHESNTNQVNCEDPFKADGIKTVSKNATGSDCLSCIARKTTETILNVAAVKTTRACVTAGQNTDGGSVCTTDNCNTGVVPNVGPGGPQMMASAGFAVLGALLVCLW